ncbi:MAG: hypothetical protein JWO60_3390 [Frankiales bacterium]|nr:hypothetical protein [Frankiales bacterium]
MVLPRPAAALLGPLGLLAAALLALPSAGALSAPVAQAAELPSRTAQAPDRPAAALTAATPTALVPAGRAADGWARYRLAEGALPPPLLGVTGFEGEVHFPLDGRDRAVRLLVPSGVRGPAPLLLVLHGLYQTTSTVERDQRWAPLARREGVVLGYGMGTSASWNAGTCCGDAVAQGVDDVAYLDRVVQVVAALHPVHPRRLHVTGFSNGAMMAYRYACERPARVAGVLAVAGTVTAECAGPRRDVAVMHVHGTADRTVPLEGLAYHPGLRSPLRPVSQTARFFGPRITATILLRFGHGWPTPTFGRFDATGAGWRFLAAHPLPARD